jgi:predicted CXXCH cytochrome family protein
LPTERTPSAALPWLLLPMLLALGVPQARGEGRVHPRLVNAASPNCITCHRELVRGKEHLHAPVNDDCASCHDVQVTEAGTRMGLLTEAPDLCLTCHGDLEAAVKLELKVPHATMADACITCHEPHASNLAHLLTAVPAELCGGCHDIQEIQEPHGGQLGSASDCTVCHAPHGTTNPGMLVAANTHAPFADGSCDACHRPPFAGRVRLQARDQRLCTGCHVDLAEPPAGGSRHAALVAAPGQRRTPCLSCHDPHMSNARKLLTKSEGDLCGGCHAAIVAAARAETGHAPAAEDCLTCHSVHVAPQPHLLAEPAQAVCTGCHDVEDADLTKAHLGAELAAVECLACHDAHGSGNPHVLARHLHAPVLDGCETCHEGSADKLVENGRAPLCLACHAGVGERARTAAVPHAAMEVLSCADCHNPHASAQERLVKLPAGGECLRCHEDKSPGEHESGHGLVQRVGCQACHEPHGGSQAKLLRTSGDALCLGCHGRERPTVRAGEAEVLLLGRFPVPTAVAAAIPAVLLSADGRRGHPTPEHPVVGHVTPDPHRPSKLVFEGELSCSACHDPHKGRYKLLRWPSRVEACLACHPK